MDQLYVERARLFLKRGREDPKTIAINDDRSISLVAEEPPLAETSFLIVEESESASIPSIECQT